MGQVFSGPVIRKIVLDPGHGGKDPGALSPDRKLREKDINLAVAKYLGQEINARYPEITVLYTRDKDVAIGLDKRGTMASNTRRLVYLYSRKLGAQKYNPWRWTETWVFGGTEAKERTGVMMWF